MSDFIDKIIQGSFLNYDGKSFANASANVSSNSIIILPSTNEDDLIVEDIITPDSHTISTNDGSKFVTKYSASQVSSEKYLPNGNLDYRYITTYDDNHEPLKYDYYSFSYNSNGDISHVTSNSFSNSNSTEVSSARYSYKYDENNNVVGKKIFTFDYCNELLSCEIYDGENLVSKDTTYLSSGLNIKINQKIDSPVLQDDIGDCWLISGALALPYSDYRRKSD